MKVNVNQIKAQVGRKVFLDLPSGHHDLVVTEANEIFFVAKNNKRKFQVSFETGKVKDLSEYNLDELA